MTPTIFEQVKAALHPRLPEVLPELLPGGKVLHGAANLGIRIFRKAGVHFSHV